MQVPNTPYPSIAYPTHTPSVQVQDRHSIQRTIVPSDNPLLSFEQNFRNKLIAIGMLDQDGLVNMRILALVPIRALNDTQMNTLKELLGSDVTIIDKQGVTHNSVSQQIFQIRYQDHLRWEKFNLDELFLCNEWAASILGVTDYFRAMVKAFLKDTGQPEDLFDRELAILENHKSMPKTVEWEYSLHGLNPLGAKLLYDAHLTFLMKESYCLSLDPSEVENRCFIDLHNGNTFVQATFGDQSKKSSSQLTKIKVGIDPSICTIDRFRIPVKALIHALQINSENKLPEVFPKNDNFHQATIDAILKIVRFDQIGLTIYEGNPIVAGFMASVKAPNAQQLLAPAETLNTSSQPLHPFLASLHQLIVTKKIHLKAVHSLLCFASWIRICHPSEEWSAISGVSVTLGRHISANYFILKVENSTLHISIDPTLGYAVLESLSHEQLHEMRGLWQLLIPSKIKSIFPKASLLKDFKMDLVFEAFRRASDLLIENTDAFLNTIGYGCIIAAQGLGKERIDSVFQKLPSLLSDYSLPEFKEELSFLASFLTPTSRFISEKDESRERTLHRFILYLFNNNLRENGRQLLDSILNSSELRKSEMILCYILENVVRKDQELAIKLFQSYFNYFSESFKIEFFFKAIETTPSQELLPHLFSIASLIFAFSFESTPERQKLLVQLLRHAVDIDFHGYATKFLEEMASPNILNDSNWEEAAGYFCTSLIGRPHHGILGAFQTWTILSSKRKFPKPKALEQLQKPVARRPIARNLSPLAQTSHVQALFKPVADSATPKPPITILKRPEAAQVKPLVLKRPIPASLDAAKDSIAKPSSSETEEKVIPPSPSVSTLPVTSKSTKSKRSKRSKRKSAASKTVSIAAPILDKQKSASEGIRISESTLLELPEHKRIEAIQSGWCHGISAERLKQLMTEAVIALINKNSNELLPVFSQYHFKEANCHFEEIQKALLAYFEKDLPNGQEIAHLQLLMKLLNTASLASCRESFLLSLCKKISSLPNNASRGASVLSSKDLIALSLLETMLKHSSAQKNPETAIGALNLLNVIWTDRSCVFSKITELLAAFEAPFFAILIQHNLLEEALSFLKFLEIHKVKKTKLSVSESQIQTLFQTRLLKPFSSLELSDSFARIKFAVKSRSNGSSDACSLLLLFLPALATEPQKFSECLDMILARLNKLNKQALADYYLPIIKAFGKAKADDAFHFLCRLKNKDNERIFFLASKWLFPEIEGSTLLDILKMQPNFFNDASPTLLSALENTLEIYVKNQGCLSELFKFLGVIRIWPIAFLKKLPVLREKELATIFTNLYSMSAAGTCTLPAETKMAYFQRLLAIMLKNPSMQLIAIADTEPLEWNTILPPECNDLKDIYTEAALALITDSPASTKVLRNLFRLRETLSCHTSILTDIKLLECLIASKNLSLIDDAIRLIIYYLQLKNDTSNQILLPIVEDLMNHLPTGLEVNHLLCLFSDLYSEFPKRFDERANAYLMNHMVAKYAELGGEDNSDLSNEETIENIFYLLLGQTHTPSFYACEHYLSHFCHSFSNESRALLRLMVNHTGLRLSQKSSDPGLIKLSLQEFSSHLSPVYLDAKQAGIRHKAMESLFQTAVKYACANLVILIGNLGEQDLFNKKFKKLFDGLYSIFNEGSEDPYETAGFQDCYLTMIEYLLELPVTIFGLTTIENCFNRLLSLHKDHRERFDFLAEKFCSLPFQLDPARQFPYYMKMILFLNHMKKHELVSEHLAQVHTLYNSIINFYAKKPIDASAKVQDAFHKVLEKNLQSPTSEAFRQSASLLAIIKPILANIYAKSSNNNVGDALQQVLEKNLQTPTPGSFQQNASLLAIMQPILSKNLPALLQSYKLFYSSLTHIDYESALPFIKRFMEEFSQKASPTPFLSLLFRTIFKECFPQILGHFNHHTEELIQLSMNFLSELLQKKFFDKPKLLTMALQTLVPFSLQMITAKIATNSQGHDYISEAFINFEKKPYMLEDELLEEIFQFMNGYLIELLTLHPKMLDHGSDILENMTPPLIYLLSRGCFDKMPFLLIRLLHSIMPCNLKLIQGKLAQEETAKDYIATALFSEELHKRTPFLSTNILDKRIALASVYIKGLLDLGHKKSDDQAILLFEGIEQLLTTLLSNGTFNKSFASYLLLVNLLIPCNTALIKRQLDTKQALTNHIDLLLFSKNACKPKFMHPDDIQRKLSLVNSLANELLKIDHPQAIELGRTMILKAYNLLSSRVKRKAFENQFSTYIECVKTFIQSNVALINNQVRKKDKPLENYIFQLLFNSDLSDPALSKAELMQKKLSVAIAFATSLLRSEQKEVIFFGIEINNKILTMIAEILSGLDTNDPSNKEFSHYLTCVKDFIPNNIALLLAQLTDRKPITDLISPLLLETHFSSMPFIKEKIKILAFFASELLRLKLASTNQLAHAILVLKSTLIKNLLASQLFDDNFRSYLSCVSKIIPINAAVMKMQIQSEDTKTDYVPELLLSDKATQESFLVPKLMEKKSKCVTLYADTLVDVGDEVRVPLVESLVAKFITSLLEQLAKGTFNDKPLLYLACVNNLNSSCVALLKIPTLQQSTKDLIYQLLFERYECKNYFMETRFVQGILINTFNIASQLCEQVAYFKSVVGLHESSSKLLLESAGYGAYRSNLPIYLNFVESLISVNVSSIKIQALQGEVLIDSVTQLLFDMSDKHPAFQKRQYLQQRLVLLCTFAINLLKIDHESVRNKGRAVLEEASLFLKGLLEDGVFDDQFSIYFESVRSLIVVAMLSQLLQKEEVDGDCISALLFDRSSSHLACQKAGHLQQRIAIVCSFATGLFNLNHKPAHHKGVAVLKEASLFLKGLLADGVFDNNFSLYLDCVDTMIPVELLSQQLQTQEIGSDCISALLFDRSNSHPACQREQHLQQRLDLLCKFAKELLYLNAGVDLKRVNAVFRGASQFLQSLLTDGVFDNNFSLYLDCVNRLIPIQIPLLEASEAGEIDVDVDCISEMLFGEVVCEPRFMNLSHVQAKSKVIQTYISALNALGTNAPSEYISILLKMEKIMIEHSAKEK